jgi:transcriptional regulator with XRE-family HTH domain
VTGLKKNINSVGSVESVADLVAEIRSQRKHKGLNQEELAGLAGLSIEGLSKIERGDAEPKLATALKLLKLLGGRLEIRWRREVDRDLDGGDPS